MLVTLFFLFFRVGLFTIGGGYAMIPLIKSELIVSGLFTVDNIDVIVADIIAIAQVTPGPFALNAATFIGMQNAGFLGAIISTAGVILPSLVITGTVAVFFSKLKSNKVIQDMFYAMRAVVAGLILATAAQMLCSQVFNIPGDFSIDFKAAGIFIAALIVLLKTKINPVFVVLAGGAAGFLLYAFF